jgi:CRISPR-associated protein Cas1
MKKLLNTLYVTTEDAYLAKEGESVIVRVEHKTKLRIPIHALGSIICFGNVSVSPYLMAFCGKQNVVISFLSQYGRFLARVEGPTTGNVLLRREQYRRSENIDTAADIARAMVIGKIANARAVLRRAVRDHSEKQNDSSINDATVRLRHYLHRLKNKCDLDTIRGIEGEASKTYFGVFDNLITSQKDDFVFNGRNRRPPTDNVNCLLSFLYTLLAHDLRGAAEAVGLDPQVGFLHRDRPGRPSLALDLMEEFRAPFADRLALSLINRRQLQARDFDKNASGGVVMNDAARKKLLIAYQERKQDEFTHPFLGEKVKVGILFLLQAKLLARHLRGDLDGYPTCFWK